MNPNINKGVKQHHLNICHDYRNHRFPIVKASDILIEFAVFTKPTWHLVYINIQQQWADVEASSSSSSALSSINQ